MKNGVRFVTLLALLAIIVPVACRSLFVGDEPTHDDVFSDEGLLTAQASQLKSTFVTSHQDVPIKNGTNILWCGTFQLAWNETCSLVKEDVHLATPSADVDALNRHLFTRADIDDDSYVAVSGYVGSGIHKIIRQALQGKFGGAATPHFIPSESLTPGLFDIVAYCYLFKNLEFPHPFERLEESLIFDGQKLSCFGIGTEFKTEHSIMYPQLLILDYKNDQDFVIELKTKSTKDRVILAKIPPTETLADTVKAVQARAAAKGEQAGPGDVLKIPKFNFDITRAYEELQHKIIPARNAPMPMNPQIVSAVQNIRFQMDEKGVRLRSEAHIAIGCAAEIQPIPKHLLVFDKPFLIMLQRVNAKSPYFALWVDNPELLIKW